MEGSKNLYSGNLSGIRKNIAKYKNCIATSLIHTVALKAGGTVVAVGSNEDGQCDTDGWKNIVAISAGSLPMRNNYTGKIEYSGITVGLKADGTVIAVGGNEEGQCDTDDWQDIAAISAGAFYTVGLKADGTVVAVGSNMDGQCNVGSWRDIAAISAGAFCTVGLKADGTVIAVGDNKDGQCNVSDWRDIAAISAGFSHTVGLKADGTVVAVGNNIYNQCNVGSWQDIGPVPEEQALKLREQAMKEAEEKKERAIKEEEQERKKRKFWRIFWAILVSALGGIIGGVIFAFLSGCFEYGSAWFFAIFVGILCLIGGGIVGLFSNRHLGCISGIVGIIVGAILFNVIPAMPFIETTVIGVIIGALVGFFLWRQRCY